MEKYKVCPTCGTKNPPTMIECIKCETDLTGVPIGEAITENEDEAQTALQNNGNQADAVKMVRTCECGTRNPASARKCSACGEDISDIIPARAVGTDEQEKVHFILSSIDGSYAYELTMNLTVIGRENIMKEYLSSKPFVSRKHAEVLIEAEKLWIKSYSNTNHTYVNNEMIKDNEYFELHDDDIIGFGGKDINGSLQDNAAYFRVRIGACI